MRHAAVRKLVLALALSAAIGGTFAQDDASGWNPRTGDPWVDTQLDDVNRYGARYREPFVDEMARYYGAPRDLVTDLLADRRWAPGDVYYACAIAQVIGRPCRYVVDAWNRDHGQGWGVVAQRLGIEPGSAEFQRLKRGFVPTYDRWSRPIVLDDDLRRAFPKRREGASASPGPGKSNAASTRPAPAKGSARKDAAAKPPGKAPGSTGATGKGRGTDAGQGQDGGKPAGSKGNGKGNGKG